VIRVHAGENPAFPENVRLACEAVASWDVTLRIGHALYGSDEALELLRKTGAFVEINLTSNFTLNNIHSTAEVPLTRLLDAGVRCVLGTDGPGLYGTTPRDELRAARLAGVTDTQRLLLSEHEHQYVSLSLRERLHQLPLTTSDETLVRRCAGQRVFVPQKAGRGRPTLWC
jgi:cytosine/adenosine deaminase-related metal-dependent hydrolase